jgi:hypothetical protein
MPKDTIKYINLFFLLVLFHLPSLGAIARPIHLTVNGTLLSVFALVWQGG